MKMKKFGKGKQPDIVKRYLDLRDSFEERQYIKEFGFEEFSMNIRKKAKKDFDKAIEKMIDEIINSDTTE